MWANLILLLQTLVLSRQNVINIAQGRIRGVVYGGFVAYTGVPYGTVSQLDGRFKAAGIAPAWSNIREPTTSTCSSISHADDCLQLDVYVPTTSGSSWPVLVWITGGCGPYNPGKLVKEGIIVVIVYHRHGAQGFLCLGDEDIPGNAGIKDVVLALRWVRDNIIAFYGNPGKIILAGQSFGAAMVDAVILSSIAPGLFHGAILQSGTALCPWAFNYDAEERAEALTDSSVEETSEEQTKYLINAEIEQLVRKANKLAVPYLPFGICSEKPLKNEERLLSGVPYELLKSKKFQGVPMLIGYNNNEAYVFLSTLREANIISRLKENSSFLLPDDLKTVNYRERRQLARQIKDMYFKKNVTMSTVLSYYRDAYFSSHIYRSVYHYSATVPVYYYQFSYTSDVGVQSEPGVEKVGAAHSDELGYLFNDWQLDEEDGTVQSHLLKLWSNFVKHLNPTPSQNEMKWKTTRPERPRLMDINVDLKMLEYPHSNTQHMWDSIYDKYYYTRNRINN